MFMYIVGITEYTPTMMMLLHLLNVTMALAGTLIVSATDSLIYVLFINIHLLSKLIENEVEDFDKELMQPQSSAIRSKQRLIRIALMHRKFTR